MPQLEDQIEAAMRRWHSVTPKLFAELSEVAGYAPPEFLAERFAALHTRLFDDATAGIEHLRRQRPNGVDWLQRFRAGLLDNVQEGMYACCYHLARIEFIESEMVRIAESHLSAIGPAPTSSAVGGGNSRALDFEYQALAFSLRRILEYVGVAVAAFFKADCHSIRGLAKVVSNAEPADRALRVLSCLSLQMPNIEDILPSDKAARRSLRDRLAHWEAVKAGCFNVASSPLGFMIGLVGGGHELEFGNERPAPHDGVGSAEQVHVSVLGPRLRAQFERTMAFTWSLVTAIGLDEAAV